MNRHLHSPTKLTEFARDFEEEPETFFSKFVNKITNAYNISYNAVNELPTTAIAVTTTTTINTNPSSPMSFASSSSSSSLSTGIPTGSSGLSSTRNEINILGNNQIIDNSSNNNDGQHLQIPVSINEKSSDSVSSTQSEDISENTEKYEDLQVENTEGRTMINVLKRISNIVAVKNNNLRNYKDTELQRFWMPDSKAKECYECCQKFSAFRRKHHCRLCGQIFCSKCCNQVVPGKIIMCSGNLKVCTYCSKIVLSYLKSSDITIDLKADLQALQDDLTSKFSQNDEQSQDSNNCEQNHHHLHSAISPSALPSRKISLGYQEERLVSNQQFTSNFSTIDRRNILQQSNSLKALHDEMIQQLPLQNCGTDLIQFLIKNHKSSNKIQAIAILNALLEAGFLNPIVPDSDQTDFDETLHYRLIRKNDVLRQSGNIQLDVDYESSSVHMSRSMMIDIDNVNDDGGGEKVNKIGEQKQQQQQLGDDVNENSQFFKSIDESLSFQSIQDIQIEDSMRSTTKTAKQLVKAYCDHEELLLSQMLRNYNLEQNWSKILIPLCARGANQIRPEFCTNDVMDIRSYVNFKKVPGGSRNDCTIIGGVVFSKNVAHKEMAKQIDRPRILLLQCPIVYERVEGKFVSIETIMLQEKEYLKNVTTRILSLKPNVVLVHKNVAGIAQEMLRSHGIILVLDVKVSVMERLARCLQCDIVTSIESNIGKPKLGVCDRFYTKCFDDGSGSSKTLMFFEMLSSPRGCCCLLRGAKNHELIKIKKVASMLIYARYNWRLELSFLLDEFARPPSPKPLIFDSKEHSPSDGEESTAITKTTATTITLNTIATPESARISSNNSSPSIDVSNSLNKKLMERKSEEKLMTIEDVKDFTDPLRAPEHHITTKSQEFEEQSVVEFAVQTPYDNRFRTALSSTVLSISPFVSFPLPYLETEQGRKCPLRSLFPNELYFSKQWSLNNSSSCNENTNSICSNTEKSMITIDSHENSNNNMKSKVMNLKSPHEFIRHKITGPIYDSKLQTLLAEFRANGCHYPKLNKMTKIFKKSNRYQQPQKATEDFIYKDALNLESHQGLPVLFCSFYFNPKATSSFCAQPTLLKMKFYGQHDIMLGQFLQRYCFRSSYICQSCNLPMLDHVRRYVHSNGCVRVFLSEESNKNDVDKIFLTSRCKYCSEITPNVPLSPDTSCLSFAKYLELRFHGHAYKKRAIDFIDSTENTTETSSSTTTTSDNGKNKCTHSLHRDYIHYFSYKGIVAKFVYSPIDIWEISIPPLVLRLNKPKPFDNKLVLEDIKNFSMKGHEVYSKIYERIAELSTEDESPTLSSLKVILVRDQFLFRQHIEIVQTLLTEKLANSYDINDAMIMAKRALADSIELWGPRLHEAAKTIQRLELATTNNSNGSQQNSTVITSSTVAAETVAITNILTTSGGSIDAGTICTEDLISETESSPTIERKSQRQEPQQQQQSLTTDEIHRKSETESSNQELQQHRSVEKPKEISSRSNQEHMISDKKSIKQLISQLLPSTGQMNSLQSPLSANVHLTLPLGAFPVLVNDQDLSSFIAYSLVSNEYKKAVENLNQLLSTVNSSSFQNDNNNSPNVKRKTNDGLIDGDEKDSPKTDEDKKSKAQHHIELYFQDLTTQFTCKIYFAKEFDALRANILKPPRIEKSLYKELELSKKREEIRLTGGAAAIIGVGSSNNNINFNVTSSPSMTVTSTNSTAGIESPLLLLPTLISSSPASVATTTAALTSPSQKESSPANQQSNRIEETRISLARSLCRSMQWEARGGKSGSKFSKTLDDRFILKEMTKNDVTKFEEDIAPNYFDYINKCLQQNQPTLLVKILGVFRVTIKKKDSVVEKSLLVMENLFYNCDIKNKFDLKGSERNRLVDPSNQNGEIVLLDENLIQMSWSNPLYVLSFSKTVLREAINRDATFLERNDVMDYSLLVGLNEKDKSLVLGIIDYIRTYTIDKRIESIVKQSGLLGGQGKLPTVISPARYKQRFIEAMDRYFYAVPDRWEGLSKK